MDSDLSGDLLGDSPRAVLFFGQLSHAGGDSQYCHTRGQWVIR